MKRDAYSDQQSRASFQPQSPQPEIKPTQFGQPLSHSSSTSNLGSKWLDKASRWFANKVQTAQNLVQGSGKAITSDQILPALKGTASQSAQSSRPLVGVIDSGFGTNEHGSKIVETIQQENPQAQIWQGGGVGAGDGLESLVEFVDTARARGQTHAVANLSFDLTEVHPDGSTFTRSQLTAEEQSALAYARDNGVLVVASSGNQGGAMSALGQASQPFDNLIVVGAANGQDRAAYSSYGKGLDLVAEVDSAGTSFAAAKVTGTIANIWNTNPKLSGHQVSQILTTTATDLNKVGWDAETGAGLLNVKGSIDLAQDITPVPKAFSGAQLIQQVGGATWKSRDGAIASERSTGLGSWLKRNVHGVLDVAGFIPGVGAVADLANAGLYAAEGDYANAALSAAAAVPGIGDAAAAAKLANRGVRAVQAANRGARTTERATSAARAIPSRPRLSSSPAPRPASPGRATRPSGGNSLSPTGRRRSAAPRPTSPSRSRRPELGRPPAAPGRRRPASDRPTSTASRRPDLARRQERQPVGVSSRRPSPRPQERRPGVGTSNRPATRRQPNHQPGLGTTRRPQSTRPESNSRSLPSRAPNMPRVEQPTANRVPSGFRRNRDQQLTQSRNPAQGRQSEPRARSNFSDPSTLSSPPRRGSSGRGGDQPPLPPPTRDSTSSSSPEPERRAPFQIQNRNVTYGSNVTSDALANGRYFTYTLRDANGEVRYVGRTSPRRRGDRGAETVFSGRMGSRGDHDILDNHSDEIAEIRIEGFQGNAAASSGAEDVLYSRHQIRNPNPVQYTTRSGRVRERQLQGGANEGDRQLLNRTNIRSTRPGRLSRTREVIKAFSNDLRTTTM